MNCFAQGSGWLACTLCLLIATLFISETSYSHSVPTPLDATSDDGTPVELVTHKDLYDDDGNFMAHIHAWSISSYTQEEVDEIHANNPHTSDAVIEGLPKVGDVKGVYGKSYRTPGFPPPDDANEIGKPDPDGISENYGSVSTPQSEDAEQSEETQAQANSIRFFASAQGDSQNQQPTTQGDSQNQQPAIQQQPTTQDDSQNQQQLAIQQQPTTQDDSQNQQQP
ncbi:MAG: hypothetical protein OXN27_20555, partial [Candidatus Poribacteria bacterium]|nr:hypothetical protein [Candidatus Poribacteria bacterium]